MADFTWEARSRTGELRKGTMEADTQAAVETRLRQQQLSPVKVKKRSSLSGLQFLHLAKLSCVVRLPDLSGLPALRRVFLDGLRGLVDVDALATAPA